MMKKRSLISLVLLVAYFVAVFAFAFHIHPGASEHVSCKICHAAGSSEKAVSQSPKEPPLTNAGFIQIKNDSTVFRFLSTFSPQRAPPSPAA
jgi:hypothetical protein